jgi:hypothetical protein
MKKWNWIFVILILTGCAGLSKKQTVQPEPTGSQPEAGGRTEQAVEDVVAYQLEDYGPAPEWQNEIWLNAKAALRLEELRGNVVLLEMWTSG